MHGYLPAAEAAAFTAAVDALVASLRVAGDGLTAGQRRADALAALVAAATEHGLPTGGGLPAALTLTVSLSEAARVAGADPARFATGVSLRPRSGSTLAGQPAGDATVRFGLCCAAITPILTDSAEPPPAGPVPAVQADPPSPASPGGLPDHRRPPRLPQDRQPAGAAPAVGSLLRRIAATPVQPLAVGRSVRLATPAQRHALRLRDRGCAIPGCAIDAAYTQPHHVTGWALGGTTDLDCLVSLCWVHHRMTELGRYRFLDRKPGDTQPPGSLAHPRWWITPPQPVTT